MECQGSPRSHRGRVVSQERDGDWRQAVLPTSGMRAGEAQPHQQPSSLQAARAAGIAPQLTQRSSAQEGTAAPSLPKGSTALKHSDTPRFPLTFLPGKPSCHGAGWVGEQSSGSSLSFRMPSTDLTAREQAFSRTLTHHMEKFQP